MRKIGLIYSQSSNGYIGKDGKLLFSIPEDMKRFKALTEGSIVIMGRKTWESLPEKFRPLPNRMNFVLSRDKNFSAQGPATFTFDSLDLALTGAGSFSLDPNIWIIGGESLYNEGLKYATVVEQTFVTKEFEGDAKAPFLDEMLWQAETGKHFKEHDGLYYQFNTYHRRTAP